MIEQRLVSFIHGKVPAGFTKEECEDALEVIGFFSFFQEKKEGILFFAHAIAEYYDDIKELENQAIEWVSRNGGNIICR